MSQNSEQNRFHIVPLTVFVRYFESYAAVRHGAVNGPIDARSAGNVNSAIVLGI